MYERCFKRIIDMILSVLGLPVFGLIYIVGLYWTTVCRFFIMR